jgi:DNA topoisomerase-3
LLSAMENAGKLVDDEELRAAMRDSGLGTPATRAAIIETLLKRGFIGREGKQLVPTPMGMALVAALPVQSLASPELTGNWEARLARIARGQDSRPAFMGDIVGYVKDIVDAIRKAAPMAELPTVAPPAAAVRAKKAPRKSKKAEGDAVQEPPGAGRTTTKSAAAPSPVSAAAHPAASGPTAAATFQSGHGVGDLVCPSCRQGQLITGKRGWGCSRWREGCKFVIWFEENGRQRTEAELRVLVKASRS